MDIFFNHWLKNTELVQRLKRVALILPFSGICFNDNWRILLFKYCDAPGSVLICVEERSVGDITEDRTPSFKLLLFSQNFSVIRKCLSSFLCPLLTSPHPNKHTCTEGKNSETLFSFSFYTKADFAFAESSGSKLDTLSMWMKCLPKKFSRQKLAKNTWINIVSAGVPRFGQGILYLPYLAACKTLYKVTKAFVFHENNLVL